MHEQRNKQREKSDTDDGVSDSPVMMEIRPAISNEQNAYITIRRVSGENAYESCSGRQSLQTRFGRS